MSEQLSRKLLWELPSILQLNNSTKTAEFIERKQCISCDSTKLEVLDCGTFGQEPHLTMIRESPWGNSPLSQIKDCDWVLVRCEECAQVFHQRVLTEKWEEIRFREWMTDKAIRIFEEARGKYSAHAKFERARGEVEHILKLEKMTRAIRNEATLRILDFGCGWGTFIAIANHFGCEAMGIDRATARQDGTKSGTRIYKDIDEFKEDRQDLVHAVTLFQVLEHLNDPKSILVALREQLVQDGILIIVVPNATGILQIKTADDLRVSGIDHINAFSPKTLEGIARSAGFEPVNSGVAHATADFHRVVKREVRRAVDIVRKPTTERYFRRV